MSARKRFAGSATALVLLLSTVLAGCGSNNGNNAAESSTAPQPQ